MLRTTGHVYREPVSTLVVSFNELFNFKSLRLVVIWFPLIEILTSLSECWPHVIVLSFFAIHQLVPVGWWINNILAVYQTQDLTMVLTAAQMATFFKHAEQMGIPHATVMQIQFEGITLVADLEDFDKDSLQHVAHVATSFPLCVITINASFATTHCMKCCSLDVLYGNILD